MKKIAKFLAYFSFLHNEYKMQVLQGESEVAGEDQITSYASSNTLAF